PAPYVTAYKERLKIAERIGFPVFAFKSEEAKQQDDWQGWRKWRRNSPQKWRLIARKRLNADDAFWGSDDLHNYEIWSVDATSRIIYAKPPRYPERLPWLLAWHTYCDKKGDPIESYMWAASLIGDESNAMQHPIQLSVGLAYCALGTINKR